MRGPLVRLTLLCLTGRLRPCARSFGVPDDLLWRGLWGLVRPVVSCVGVLVPFPYIELLRDANEVRLLHGTSVANAAFHVVEATDRV